MRRFCSQVWLYAKVNQANIDWLEFIFFRIGVSMLTLIFYVLIASFTTGEIDLSRWVVGNAFVLCTYECIHIIGVSFNGERFNGRLRSIIVSPTSKLTVLMYTGSWAVFSAFLTIGAAFLAGGLIFGVSFAGFNVAAFLISIAITAFACVGLGLLIGIFALITDSMYLILNAVAMLIMIFSGANFPVEQLPPLAQLVAGIMPVQRGIAAANQYFNSPIDIGYWRLVGGEALLGIVFILLAFILIKAIEGVAIKKATLEI